MLTPFMQELVKLLDQYDFDAKMVRDFTVDGPSHKITVTSYVKAEDTADGYRKVIDPKTGEAVTKQQVYPMTVPC